MILAALLGLLSLQAPPSPPPSPEEVAWKAALEFKQKSDWTRAAEAFGAYAASFPGTARGIEAQIEQGVCWFSLGRERQVHQRNNEASLAAFARASALFAGVTSGAPTSALAPRAQYMRGTVAHFAGDLGLAEQELGIAIERHATDARYLLKSLDRRAAVRRHLLRTDASLLDLERLLREFPKDPAAEPARVHLAWAKTQLERPAPALTAREWAQGGPLTLEALQGEVVLLWFFATWCENCEAARPALLSIEQRYRPQGLRFVGVIDTTRSQSTESVREYAAAKGVGFPVALDTGATALAYRGQKIPDVVLIDRLGRVRWHDNPANLQDATLELLLGEDPDRVPTRR
jgi:thiol-disulfide isomerase/thioredoxin